ncbi:SGNH/GDSL hydrolase family protein [Pengzhenrongella sp.]|jgi:lysophospholipase L1-like esterase|uniref:SGNH/GDSL hydrolase family protein n=1 Tax=Pengzhenrongella sp. TaxID=2888820 RepID=UPI002F92D15C
MKMGRAWRSRDDASSWRYARWATVGAAVVVLGVLVLAATVFNRPGPGGSSGAKPVTVAMVASPAPRPLVFAAVGDSITAANSDDLGQQKVGDGSWVYYARSSELRFGGGWAHGGAQSSAMARNARFVRADVLVIIAGINDYRHHVPFATTSKNLLAIARTVGADRVIVSAIPPSNVEPAIAAEFNRKLKPFVEAQGWTYMDAMADLRDGKRYAPGMTWDGTHPTQAAAKLIGAAIAKAIVGHHGVSR